MISECGLRISDLEDSTWLIFQSAFRIPKFEIDSVPLLHYA